MGRIWTHGVWTVKAGREDEFVRAWLEMASAAREELDPPEPPHPLRDWERPNVFVSFSPWASVETIEQFREQIRPHIGAIHPLLESFEPSTLDEVPVDG